MELQLKIHLQIISIKITRILIFKQKFKTIIIAKIFKLKNFTMRISIKSQIDNKQIIIKSLLGMEVNLVISRKIILWKIISMVKRIMIKNQINIYNRLKIVMKLMQIDLISKEKFKMKVSFLKLRKIFQILICKFWLILQM